MSKEPVATCIHEVPLDTTCAQCAETSLAGARVVRSVTTTCAPYFAAPAKCANTECGHSFHAGHCLRWNCHCTSYVAPADSIHVPLWPTDSGQYEPNVRPAEPSLEEVIAAVQAKWPQAHCTPKRSIHPSVKKGEEGNLLKRYIMGTYSRKGYSYTYLGNGDTEEAAWRDAYAKIQAAEGEAKPQKIWCREHGTKIGECDECKPVATPTAPDPELEELARLYAKATPAPWLHKLPNCVQMTPGVFAIVHTDSRHEGADAANAALIVAMRNTLPKLLTLAAGKAAVPETVEQLRSALSELAQTKAALAEAKKDVVGIACPFCGEDDYDLIGLKFHIWSCDEYNAVRSIRQERAAKIAATEGSK